MRASPWVSSFAVVLLLGCGPAWVTHVQSGPPSALLGTRVLKVGFDFDQAMVDNYPAATWRQAAGPEEAMWVTDALTAIAEQMQGELASRVNVSVVPDDGAPAQPGEARLRVVLVEMRRGPRGPCCGGTYLSWRFDFYVGDALTDSIEADGRVDASITSPSVAGRAARVSRSCAARAAQFFAASR